MAGPNDPRGPQEPHGPHGHGPGDQHGPHEPGDASGHDGPFEHFEPMTGYGASRSYPDPYGRSEAYSPEKRANGYNHDRPPEGRRRFSPLRLWAGGVAVALVAALSAAVALLLVRGVLDIPVFAPKREGMMELTSTGQLALGAAVAALVATAVLHLLLLATPQPGRFLGWIIALGTAAAMLAPFTTDASWESKAGTAGVYLVIGVVIGTLMATVARSASGASRS
jgi:hypothetical protein